MTQNQIAYWGLQETKRHNETQERETNRANLAQESLKNLQINLDYDLGLRTLGETTRANQARELETNRHNLATEALQHFQNLINAKNAETNRMQIGLGYANLGLGYSNLAESIRSNLANEALKGEANQNTFLKDRENYSISTRQLAENNRHNLAVEDETHRNNVTNQLLGAARLMNDINLGTAQVGLQALNSVNSLFKPTKSKLGGIYLGN